MTDEMPINVMMCNPETLEVTYCNKTSAKTLNSIQSLLSEGVTGDSIVGQCIDIFHKK